MSINWSSVRFGILAVVFSGFVAYFAQPLVHGNDSAMNIMVTVFSVLAGFLVAIIAIVGDPVLLPPGTWKAAEMERSKLSSRLERHKLLFSLYLITLALIFFAVLLPETYPKILMGVEMSFLFFGVLAFTVSLRLPGSLIQVQRERIDAIIEHRRSEDGIPKK